MTSTTSTWDDKQKQLSTLGKPTGTLSLCADPEIRDRYQRAKQEHASVTQYVQSLPKDGDKDARAVVDKRLADATAQLEQAEQAYTAITVVLTFQALERKQLEKLRAQHPATEEDEEVGRDFHFDTFAPALISASSVDGMPLEYAQQAMETWSLGDAEDLWMAAWSIQQRKRSDLGKG